MTTIEKVTNGYIVCCNTRKEIYKTIDEMFVALMYQFESIHDKTDNDYYYAKLTIDRNKPKDK